MKKEEYETEDEEKVEYGEVRCNKNIKEENDLKTKEDDPHHYQKGEYVELITQENVKKEEYETEDDKEDYIDLEILFLATREALAILANFYQVFSL